MHVPRIQNPRRPLLKRLHPRQIDLSGICGTGTSTKKTAKAKARHTSLPEESELLRDLLLPTAWKYLSKTSMDISFFQPEA